MKRSIWPWLAGLLASVGVHAEGIYGRARVESTRSLGTAPAILSAPAGVTVLGGSPQVPPPAGVTRIVPNVVPGWGGLPAPDYGAPAASVIVPPSIVAPGQVVLPPGSLPPGSVVLPNGAVVLPNMVPPANAPLPNVFPN